MGTDTEHVGAPPSIVGLIRARIAETLSFHPREAIALGVLGALLLAGATLAYVRARPSVAAAPIAATAAAPSGEPAPAVAGAIFVHVVGAVRSPGVYEFSEGARVVDAVRAAGGLLPGADYAAINMARVLTDGEQIVVPRKGEPTAPGAPAAPAPGGVAAAQGDKVNLNTATASDLEELPGIGPVLAERIVEYRDQHGPFRSVRDLMKVSGIGPKTFESLEPHITV